MILITCVHTHVFLYVFYLYIKRFYCTCLKFIIGLNNLIAITILMKNNNY